MKLKPQHKAYILKHEQDIRESNWQEFFRFSEDFPGGIGGPLYLANISFMDELKCVPWYAFYKCTGLNSIIIPYGVTWIDCGAFCECSGLTSISIPASVTRIGDYAFYNISTDLKINYGGTKEQWKQIRKKKNAFIDTYYTVKCVDGNIVKKRK